MPTQPNTTYGETSRLIAAGAVKHWGLAVSGVISSVLGWALPALGFEKVPPRLLWFTGAILVLWAAFRAYHDLRLERDQLALRLQPDLSIVLGPRAKPYFQQDLMSTTVENRVLPILHRLWRVGISNTGGPVSGVALVLEGCVDLFEPGTEPPFFFPDHSLRAMDSRCDSTGRFRVPAGDGPVVFVDVASEFAKPDDIATSITLPYAQGNLPNTIRRGSYRLTLRLEAGEAKPIRKAVRLEYDDKEQLVMIED